MLGPSELTRVITNMKRRMNPCEEDKDFLLDLQPVGAAMGQQLSFDNMRQPLKPDEYGRIFQADVLELAISDNHQYLRLIDLPDANPKDECEHLVSERVHDSHCTATLTLAIHQGADTSRKRRRTGGGDGAMFPPTDVLGKRINQGYGGDLSFSPAAWPIVCKQSAKFVRLTDDPSEVWEVNWLVQLQTSLIRQQGLRYCLHAFLGSQTQPTLLVQLLQLLLVLRLALQL